jgi:hypothetical protein
MRTPFSGLEIIEDNIINQGIRVRFMYDLMSINQVYKSCFFDSSVI